MNQFIEQLLPLILTPVATVAAVTWLLKIFITKSIDKEIEKYKSDLDLIKSQRFHEYSRFYDKQLEVISTLYAQLVDTHEKVMDLVSILQYGSQSLTAKKLTVSDTFNKASAYFRVHRIYLPNHIVDLCNEYFKTTHSALIDFDTSQLGNEEYSPDSTGLWIVSFESVKEKATPILKELETEFRSIVQKIS
jgi:hypothetical protein